MAQASKFISAVEKAVSIVPSLQGDIAKTINMSLREHGLRLDFEGVEHVTKRKPKAKESGNGGSKKQAQGTRKRGRKKEGERTNADAIEEALKALGKGNSTELEEKLDEIGHSMDKATMHTTLAKMANDGLIEKEGTRRKFVYSLAK